MLISCGTCAAVTVCATVTAVTPVMASEQERRLCMFPPYCSASMFADAHCSAGGFKSAYGAMNARLQMLTLKEWRTPSSLYGQERACMLSLDASRRHSGHLPTARIPYSSSF